MTDNSGKCDDITWIFSSSVNTVTLFEHGKIHEDAKAKSVKLSLSGDCSLDINKVTAEDSGHYTCRQFNKPGQKHGQDPEYVLSVVNGEYLQQSVLFTMMLTLILYKVMLFSFLLP